MYIYYVGDSSTLRCSTANISNRAIDIDPTDNELEKNSVINHSYALRLSATDQNLEYGYFALSEELKVESDVFETQEWENSPPNKFSSGSFSFSSKSPPSRNSEDPTSKYSHASTSKSQLKSSRKMSPNNSSTASKKSSTGDKSSTAGRNLQHRNSSK